MESFNKTRLLTRCVTECPAYKVDHSGMKFPRFITWLDALVSTSALRLKGSS